MRSACFLACLGRAALFRFQEEREVPPAESAFVPIQMHQQGILKTDDLITRFFRLCTEMCVEISYRAQAEQQHNPAANPTMIRAKCYHNLDAFVRLIALLVKHSGEATNTVTKINLLNKVWKVYFFVTNFCPLFLWGGGNHKHKNQPKEKRHSPMPSLP